MGVLCVSTKPPQVNTGMYLICIKTFHDCWCWVSTNLGPAVLDDVPFIQDTIVPANARKEVDVISDDVIGCHHQVVLAGLALQPVCVQTSLPTFTHILRGFRKTLDVLLTVLLDVLYYWAQKNCLWIVNIFIHCSVSPFRQRLKYFRQVPKLCLSTVKPIRNRLNPELIHCCLHSFLPIPGPTKGKPVLICRYSRLEYACMSLHIFWPYG